MNTHSIAGAYAQAVLKQPKLQHAAVRIGLWIASVADQQGGLPVSTYISALQEGLHTDTVDAPGIAFRTETVRDGIEALVDAGLLTVQPDPAHPTKQQRGPKLFNLIGLDDD